MPQISRKTLSYVVGLSLLFVCLYTNVVFTKDILNSFVQRHQDIQRIFSNETETAVQDHNNITINKRFQRHQGVVIATKVHGPQYFGQTRQMICLLTQAYNKHVQYDIVIFSTLPWRQAYVDRLISVAGGANVTIITDNITLEEHVANMTNSERAYLFQRCKVKEGENISWDHDCCEENYPYCTRLSYAWQAEFRSYNVWLEPILQKYKYMFWFDTDSMCTKPWRPEQDPIQMMIDNDLVLLFDNTLGYSTGHELQKKMLAAYNKSICSVEIDQTTGSLNPNFASDCIPTILLVHGFFHITNLDFYRNRTNINWAKILVRPHRFSRQWDDQIAVTVPAAMLNPHRSWDMRSNGLNLSVWHNGDLDGKDDARPRGYIRWFHAVGQHTWGEAREQCFNVIVDGGRRN